MLLQPQLVVIKYFKHFFVNFNHILTIIGYRNTIEQIRIKIEDIEKYLPI